MGASQSTGGGPKPAADDVIIKTSYYELLGLERGATEDEIKKAYRKKALELHPDRNYGDVDRTTTLFAEIQSAYQVLSDPQERAWYDAHEGDILRGGAGEGGEDHYENNMRSTTADDISRVMGKFRSNVEYSDAPNGFFGFVREFFEELKQEEENAADWENVDIPNYPSFGHKNDTYEEVVRDFYAAWSGFSTKKTFAWKDEHRLSEAPDRRYRRAMEKENQSLRDNAKREYNQAVSSLLLFVRKRDPRYTPNQQTNDERMAAQRAATKAQAARARAAKEAQTKGNVPEWATRRDMDEVAESTDEEIEEEHFECVACNKTFKSENQWDAHERSKKHQKAFNALKKSILKDNAHMNLGEDVSNDGVFTPMEEEVEEVEELEELEELPSEDGEEAQKETSVDGSVNGIAQEMEKIKIDSNSPDEDSDAWASDQGRRKPRKKTKAKAKVKAKANSKPTVNPSAEPSDAPAADDEEAPLPDTPEVEPSEPGPETLDSDSKPLDPDPTTSTLDASNPKPLGKAALKRAKRAAKQSELEQDELPHKCAVCKSAFPSKSKLFEHIKENDHAAPPTEVKGGGASKKKGKRQ